MAAFQEDMRLPIPFFMTDKRHQQLKDQMQDILERRQFRSNTQSLASSSLHNRTPGDGASAEDVSNKIT